MSRKRTTWNLGKVSPALIKIFGSAPLLLCQGLAYSAQPPKNTETFTTCPLAAHPDGSYSKYRGTDIEYQSARQIDYSRAKWNSPSESYISWEGFDSSVLGYPGYEGDSRDFTVNKPVNLRIVAIDVRNVGGELKYHYFTNETANSPMENWSSTKSFVMLQGAHTLRFESEGHVGYDSYIGRNYLGSYVDHVAKTSHNETANWFKSLTGSAGSQNFLRNWIGTNATFGGLHSKNIRQIGSQLRDARSGKVFSLPRAGKWNGIGTPNTLSPLVMAEFWKRMAVNSTDPITWLKEANYQGPVLTRAQRKAMFFRSNRDFSVQSKDLKVLLYGKNKTSNFGGLLMGATKSDGLVAAVGGKNALDRATGGKWRFFGKTGSGSPQSTRRNRDEAAFGGYVCIPAGSKNAPEGKLIAFFMNIQAKNTGVKYSVRNQALRKVIGLLAPKVHGDRSVWSKADRLDPLAGKGPTVGTQDGPSGISKPIFKTNTVCKVRSLDGYANIRTFPIKQNQLVGGGTVVERASSGDPLFMRGILSNAQDGSKWASVDSSGATMTSQGELRRQFGPVFIHSNLIDWNSCL